MASPLAVLTRNRDFRHLFLAELVVFGADWFVMVPLLVLLHRLTGASLYGGLALAVDTGVVALLLPYAGTVADRLDRRKIVTVANAAALVTMLLLLAVRGPGTAWLAIAAVGGVAVAKAFYTPAASAALPNLVDPDDLAPANAIGGAAWGTMTVVGASLGGVLSAAVGPYICFGLASASLAAAAVLGWSIRRPMQRPRDGARPPVRARAALAESLSYLSRTPRVLALVTVKSAVGLGNGVLTVFPVLAVQFGAGELGTGALFAVRGAGALVGPLLLRRVLTRRSWLLPGLALSMGAYGVAYLGASAAGWFGLVLALVFVAHLAGGSNWTLSNFALQAEVPDELRGRVFATDVMLAMVAISVSQLAVGAVVDHVAIRPVIAACGATTLCYAIGWRLTTRRLALADREAVAQPGQATTADRTEQHSP